MNRAAYLKHLSRLELSQAEAGAYFEASARTGQRWAAEGPPLAVAMALLAVDGRKELDRLRTRARHNPKGRTK